MDSKIDKGNKILTMVVMGISIFLFLSGGFTIYANKTIDKRIEEKTKKYEVALENIALFLESKASDKEVKQFKEKKQNGLKSIILGDEWEQNKP